MLNLAIQQCRSLDEVRANIDLIDRDLVRLLSVRAAYVRQAATFKSSTQEVAAPQRVEQVLSKVRTLSQEHGLEVEVAEATYRAMIAAYIELERQLFEAQSRPDRA
jgi:isochorismate pyruvate lyase